MEKFNRIATLLLVSSLCLISCKKHQAKSAGFTATLKRASTLTLPHETDSNSPSFWVGNTLNHFMSTGHPFLAQGQSLETLETVGPITFNNTLPGGRWFEAVIPDRRGVLYAFYHYEPRDICQGNDLTAPEIGLARSGDGMTWTDLGILIRSGNPLDCNSPSRFFAGGVGDQSVMLDHDERYLYIYYSTYDGPASEQGVAVARMLWDERDEPKVFLYRDGQWDQPGDRGKPTPIWAATHSWNTATADAFWGPSLHWNTYLERYVILVNKTKGADFTNDGAWVAYSTSLDLSDSWSTPAKLVPTLTWYPQVVGLEPGTGTDKVAGKTARFFLRGKSEYEIVFEK